VNKVISVLLLSRKPLNKIDKVYLDFDSRTSARLVQVLSRSYWKIAPAFERLEAGQAENFSGKDAIVAIGDKTFGMRKAYPYVYDLAEEWIKFTGLPFVFAVWISLKPVSEEVKTALNLSLAYGISNIGNVLKHFSSQLPQNADCYKYLTENISYPFDKTKRDGLNLFLSYL
jgi:chorismate dehydratase